MSNFTFKSLIFLFVLSIIGLTVWAYPVIKERYAEEVETETEENSEREEAPSGQTDGSSADGLETDKIDSEDKNPQVSEEVRNDTFVEITKTDCENECKNFKEEEDATYCKQVCGLVTLEERSGCDNLEDLEKDYCLKDLAIKKTDAKLCEQIDDKNIRTTCTNRIMEDIIDKQMEGRNAESF